MKKNSLFSLLFMFVIIIIILLLLLCMIVSSRDMSIKNRGEFLEGGERKGREGRTSRILQISILISSMIPKSFDISCSVMSKNKSIKTY